MWQSLVRNNVKCEFYIPFLLNLDLYIYIYQTLPPNSNNHLSFDRLRSNGLVHV